MAQQGKRRPGRPAIAPSQRKRRNLTFRVRDEMLNHLQAEAERSGRSISEEIEHRLERTFIDDRLARLHAFSRDHNFRLASELTVCAALAENRTGRTWVEDEKTRTLLAAAFIELLQPTPEPVLTSLEQLSDFASGRSIARAVRSDIKLIEPEFQQGGEKK